jgi:subtilisin inhibitor-like
MVVAAAALVLAAPSSAAPRTSLTVTYWDAGLGSGKPVTWTLRCAPARGTLAKPAAACARLSRSGWQVFAPVPENAVCTEVYGGPQVALVVGVVDGRRLWAKVQRRNGCEAARWSRLSPWLLPAGRAT